VLPLPIRIVSDWHFGHPGSRIQSIAQVEAALEGVGTLVVAGDGREELMADWRERGEALWQELVSACRERGIELVALTGNHDPGISGEGWLKLQDGRVLVTHGDMVYDAASPWSRYFFNNRQHVEDYLRENPATNLHERWRNAVAVGRLLRPCGKASPGFFGNLKQALWPPERLLEILKVWSGFVKQGDAFLERFSPKTEVMVCGHFHRPGEFRYGQRRVINTGSLMKFCRGAMVDFDGVELSIQQLRLR
jgi:predicted phosphodiesterase